MSDVLSNNKKDEFNNNIRNFLELYKIKIQNGLKNDYIQLNDIQKSTIDVTLSEIDGILKIL